MLRRGVKNVLEISDLPGLIPSDTADACSKTIHKHYDYYAGPVDSGTNDDPPRRRTRRPIFRALCRMSAPFLLVSGLLTLFSDLLTLAIPLILNQLLATLPLEPFPVLEASLYAASLPIILLLTALLQTHVFLLLFRFGLRVQTSLTSMLYAKALRLNLSRSPKTSGELSNVVTSDVSRLNASIVLIHTWWSSILQVALVLIQLSFLVGPSTWAGVGVLLLTFPVNAVIIRSLAKTRKALLVASDARLKLISGSLNAIRTIKSFGYEVLFERAVDETRARELRFLRRYVMLLSVLISSLFVVPTLATVVVLSLYAGLGNTLTPSVAFSAIVLFNLLAVPFGLLPISVSNYVESWVSIKRIQAFLDLPEVELAEGTVWEGRGDSDDPHGPASLVLDTPSGACGTSCPSPDHSDYAIWMVGGTFVWSLPQDHAASRTSVQPPRRTPDVRGTVSTAPPEESGARGGSGGTVGVLEPPAPEHWGAGTTLPSMSNTLGGPSPDIARDLDMSQHKLGVIGILDADLASHPSTALLIHLASDPSTASLIRLISHPSTASLIHLASHPERDSSRPPDIPRATDTGQHKLGVSEIPDADLASHPSTASLIRLISDPEQDSSRPPDQTATPLTRTKPVLYDISLQIPRGQLVAIVGPVGSGKSSLLLAILGELVRTTGSTRVEGSVAYAPQKPWIKNATLRDNVVFGQPLDRQRYREALYVSGISGDLDQIPGRDLTELGEGGITLSGGQQARVSLARCIYSGRDLYLLDDPLSALDAHIGAHVFSKCFSSQGGYLRGRTRVLVLNYLHYLQHVDYVVYLQHGEVCQAGPVRELLSDTQPTTVRLGVCGEPVPSLRELVASALGGVGRQTGEASAASGTESLAGAPPFYPSMESSTVTSLEVGEVEESLPQGLGDTDFSAIEQLVLGDEAGRSGSGSVGESGGGDAGGLMQAETRAKGAVRWAVYRGYFREFGTLFEFGLTMVVFLAYFAANVLLNLWLTGFTDSALLPRVGIPSSVVGNYTIFVSVYLSLTALILVLEGTRFLAPAMLCVQASKRLFRKMYARLLLAKISWFDRTPLGRIVNRCSSDVNTVDQVLLQTISNVLVILSQLLVVYVILLISSPVLLAPLVIVATLYYFVQWVYRRSSIQLQRIASLAKSPIYSLIGETFTGVVTLRSFNRTGVYRQRIRQHLNLVVRTSWPLLAINQWLGIRLSALGILIVVVVAVLAVAGRSVLLLPSLAGLALSQVLTTTGWYLELVQNAVLLETNMNAVERVLEYGEATQAETAAAGIAGDGGGAGEEEGGGVRPGHSGRVGWWCGHRRPHTMGIIPLEPLRIVPGVDGPLRARGWPSAGEIHFVDLVFRYRPELEPSLRGVTLVVPARQKVGVVGKTGSGKSTLLKALLRIAEPSSGKIVVDGVDTTQVGLSLLRQSISYVPQDPVVFPGTVRSNLDWAQRCALLASEDDGDSVVGGQDDEPRANVPELTDEMLWEALEAVRIAEVVRALPLGLDTELSGSDLSVGEKQLLCFARCLLHGGKIVCLDEATASIDMHSDTLIQQALRTHFQGLTIVVIAHRLDTIIDSDTVVVMRDGEVGESGPPWELLQREGSLFSQLVGETGDHAAVLREAARRAHECGGFGAVDYLDLVGGVRNEGSGGARDPSGFPSEGPSVNSKSHGT